MGSQTISVLASSDDAFEQTNVVTLTDATANPNSSDEDFVGLRFQGLNVPAGATITNAWIQVYIDDPDLDNPNHDIWFEATDDAATFTTAASNISSRTPTSANVSWSSSGVGTGHIVSPSLVAPLQEVIDRPGWSSGQSVAVIIMCSLSSANLEIRMYDGRTEFEPAPLLYVEWSGGTEGTIHEIVINDTMGFAADVERKADANRQLTDNIGIQDEVHIGRMFEIDTQEDMFGFSDSVVVDSFTGDELHELVINDSFGFSDDVDMGFGWHEIVVNDMFGFDTDVPGVENPDAYLKLTVDCEIDVVVEAESAQEHTTPAGSTIRSLAGDRYRR